MILFCCVRSGRIKAIIKEFIERRVKLKLAEHVAEELADAVKTEISEKERRIRDEYESKMRRCVCVCSYFHCTTSA